MDATFTADQSAMYRNLPYAERMRVIAMLTRSNYVL